MYTIGHSNHAIEPFLGRLRRYGIEAVADVRSRPYSRFVPHFSKERLARLLAEAGIGYVFLGAELGGRPPKGGLVPAAADYASRVRQPEFRGGIEHLLGAARERRVAMLCRERDPLDCHRLHLICRYLGPLALPIGAPRWRVLGQRIRLGLERRARERAPWLPWRRPAPRINYLDFDLALRERQDLREVVRACLADLKRRGIVDWLDLDALWARHDQKRANHADVLTMLASLEINLKVREGAA